MTEVGNSKYILVVLPDLSCRPVRVDADLSVDLGLFCRTQRPPHWNLYYVSPSWVQRLPEEGVFTLVNDFTTKIPDFRLQFLPEGTPDYILRLYPYTEKDVKLAPWNIIVKEDSSVSLDMVVENFRYSFPVVGESFQIEFDPDDGFGTAEPVMDNRNKLKSVKVYVKVEISDRVASKAKEKVEILKEILSTEESYVRLLRLMNQSFNEELFLDLQMDTDIYRRTFKSIGEISPTHEKFLDSLRKAGTEVEAGVGGVFAKYLAVFRVASPHVCNFQRANRELVELLKTHKPFANRVRQICKTVFDDSQTVDGLLITPVQRIPRYPLLLKELLKATPEVHWDHDDIKESQNQILELVKGIDSKQREQYELNFVFELQRQFGSAFTISHPGRKGYMALENVKVNNEFKASIYLFNDLLLCRRLLPEKFVEFSLLRTTLYHANEKMVIDNRFYLQESQKTHEFARLFQSTKRKLIADLGTFGKALTWVADRSGPPNLTEAVIAAVDDDLYMFGGKVGQDKVSSNMWHCRDGRWVKLSTVNEPSPRFGCSMCVWGNKLVVFGGQNNTTFFNDLLLFDTTKKTWSRIGAVDEPEGRSGHAAAFMDTQLWIFGGRNATYLNDLVVFDFAQSKWWHIEPKTGPESQVPSPRAGVKAFWSIAADGNPSFAIFGGYHNSAIFNDVWVFSYSQVAWCQIPTVDPPSPRYGHCLVRFEQNLFLIGGRDSKGPTTDAYRLDLSKSPYTWSYVPQADEPNYFIDGCACELPGFGIVCFGGDSYVDSSARAYRMRLLYSIEVTDDKNKKYTRQRPGERQVSRPIYDGETKMVTAAVDDPLSEYVFSLKFDRESLRQSMKRINGNIYWRLTSVLDMEGRSSIVDCSDNFVLSETSFRLLGEPEKSKDESYESAQIGLTEAHRKSRSQRRSQGWVHIHGMSGESKQRESKRKHHRSRQDTKGGITVGVAGVSDDERTDSRRKSTTSIVTKSKKSDHVPVGPTWTYSTTGTTEYSESCHETDDENAMSVRRSMSNNPPVSTRRKERVRSRFRKPFIIDFGKGSGRHSIQTISKTSESDVTSDFEDHTPRVTQFMPFKPVLRQVKESPSAPQQYMPYMPVGPTYAQGMSKSTSLVVDPNDPLINIDTVYAAQQK